MPGKGPSTTPGREQLLTPSAPPKKEGESGVKVQLPDIEGEGLRHRTQDWEG